MYTIQTYGRFSDLFAIASMDDSADKGFNTSYLANDSLVSLVIAC